MTDTTTPLSPSDESSRMAGRLGLFFVAGLAIVLLVHPFGTTDLYDDGFGFLDHVNWFWMVLHFLGAVLFLGWPPVIDAWANGLERTSARLIGQWAHTISIAGVGVGTIHLVGTDTMTFWAYRDTYDAAGGSEAAQIGADLLLRLHAATLSAWTVVFFMAVPLLGGIATLVERRYPRWVGFVGVLGGGIQVPALLVTVTERQWTTLSEQIMFRTGVTLFIGWMIVVAWSLRRGAPVGMPAPVATSAK